MRKYPPFLIYQFTLEFHVKGVGRLAAGLDTTDQATIVSTQLDAEKNIAIAQNTRREYTCVRRNAAESP